MYQCEIYDSIELREPNFLCSEGERETRYTVGTKHFSLDNHLHEKKKNGLRIDFLCFRISFANKRSRTIIEFVTEFLFFPASHGFRCYIWEQLNHVYYMPQNGNKLTQRDTGKMKDLRRIAIREFLRNVANKINKIKAKSLSNSTCQNKSYK
jgi:hypothetical protein